jgi:hypothetical protein
VLWLRGELACVQGELFVLFELWIGGVCSLLEHGFVSDVSSRCPCLRGPRFLLLQVILLFAFPLAFDRFLEFPLVVSFLFSLLSGYQILCVVNALIKGEIEDHVCFKDRWMVASWCDG